MGLRSLGRTVCYVFFLFLPVLCAVDNPTVNDVLAALERTVKYYLENHRDINLDGIYGLRVVEGQLLQILNRQSSGLYPHLSPAFVGRLEALNRHAHNISESALPFLRFQDKMYYNSMKPLVDYPTTVFQSYRRLDHSIRWTENFNNENAGLPKFDEELSDRCMSELMGTTQAPVDDDKAMEQDVVEKTKCKPTLECLRLMFSRGREEYELTHQLLYTLLAEQMRCTPVLDQWLREHEEPLGVKQMQLEFCTNNFAEMHEKVSLIKGNIHPIYQDLFMEQQFVCPVLGFMEFLHIDWLKQILSWQQPSGCYGKMTRQLPMHVLAKKHVDYSYEENDKIIQKHQIEQPAEQAHSRHIRDQFGVKDHNAVVKQTNDSVLELHHFPEGENHRFNQVAPPFGQPKDNSLSTGAPGHNEPFGQGLANHEVNNHDVFLADGFEVREPQEHGDRFAEGGPAVNMNGQANREELQDDGILFQRKLNDPLGGNIQGFQRDQFLQDVQALNDREDQDMVQQREGFRRLLSDEKWTGRKLLVEKRLADGCLSHKTAVAAGALSQYLRFMIDPGTSVYKDYFKLDGANLLLQPMHRSNDHMDSQAQDGLKAKNLLRADEDENRYKGDELGENQEEDDDYANEKDEDLGGDGPNADGRDDARDDYADLAGDEDDEDQDEEDSVNPKMQPLIHGKNAEKRLAHPQNGDKEYEQYIDEEEQQQNLALNVGASNRRHNPGIQQDNLFNVLSKQHQEEESYSYYDNQEDHPEGPGIKNQKTNTAAKDISAVTSSVYLSGNNTLVSPTRLYLVVTAFTVVILYFMFKFVRRRRVIIRYYHH